MQNKTPQDSGGTIAVARQVYEFNI